MKNAIIPYNDTFETGFGVNSVTGEAKGTILTGDLVLQDTLGARGQTVEFNLTQIDSCEHLYESLGISVDVSAGFGLFSASGKFKFAEESNFNSHSIFVAVSVKVQNPKKTIKTYNINPDAVQYLRDGKTEQFYQKYGDSFVSGIITGGEFYALIEIQSQDERTKREISAELDVSYGAMGMGFDLSAKFNSAMEKIAKKSSISIRAFTIGGKGEYIETTVNGIIEFARRFPKIVESDNAFPYSVILQSYETLALPDGPSFVDIENKKYQIESYFREIIACRQVLSDIAYLKNNPEQFIEEEVDQFIKNDMHKDAELAAYIEEYRKHASKCAAHTSECGQFIPSVPKPLIQLPKRKNTLETVVVFQEKDFTGERTFLAKGGYANATELGNGFDDSISSMKIPLSLKVVAYDLAGYNGSKHIFTDSVPDLQAVNFDGRISSLFITDADDEKEKPESGNYQPLPRVQKLMILPNKPLIRMVLPFNQ